MSKIAEAQKQWIDEQQAELARIQDEERKLWIEAKGDPERFFANRSLLPNDLSYEATRQSTFFWAKSAHLAGILPPEIEKGALHYADDWPLPVGKRALKSRWGEVKRQEAYYGNPLVMRDAMPFSGDEEAAWIFNSNVGQTQVECFGLVSVNITESTEEEKVYNISGMNFRIISQGAPPASVLSLCANVEAWWWTFSGKRLTVGRPKGTQRYSKLEYVQLIRNYVATHGPDITRDQFLEEAGTPLRTFRRWTKDWGTTWPKLLKEAHLS